MIRKRDSLFSRLRALFFLVALIGVILTIPLPFTEESPNFFRLIYTAIFCVAGYLLSMQRNWLMWYISIAAPALIFSVSCTTYPGYATLDLIRDLLTLTLQMFMIVTVLKFSLLNAEAHEVDRIIAGVCGYLVLALLWADIYAISEYFSPGSVLFSNGDPVSRYDGSLIYFSIVTLTTLGYGEITPATPMARMLAALEAAAGTIYLAVLIASLMAGLRFNRIHGDDS